MGTRNNGIHRFIAVSAITLIFFVSGCTTSASRLVRGSYPSAPVSTPVDFPNMAMSDDINFHALTVDDGLSSNLVRSVVQDFSGFIWIATEDGLNRYDGKKFTAYRHQNSNPLSIASNDINVLYVDENGTLWIGTNGSGLDRYDRQTDQFIHYTHDPVNPASISSDLVLTLFQDTRGDLWIGTVGGLNKLDPHINRFDRYVNTPGDPNTLVSNSIFSIAEDASGFLWIGTGNGLDRMEPDRASFTHYRNDPEDPASISSNAILVIYSDPAGDLWIGTEGGGLNLYDPIMDGFHHYLTATLDPTDPETERGISVRSIHQMDTTMLIGTLGNGLFTITMTGVVMQQFRHNVQNQHSLSDDRIQAIFLDRSGLLWIATAGGGLNQLDVNRNRFQSIANKPGEASSLSAGSVLAILGTGDANLWVGLDGGGLDHVDTTSGTVTHHMHDLADPNTIASDQVKALFQDHLGDIWVGTDRGLNRFEPGSETYTYYQHDPRNINSLGDNRITAIVEDRSNILWIGTESGLERYTHTTETFDHYRHIPDDSSSLVNNHILSLVVDEQNDLWVGTTDGLDRYNRENDRFIHMWDHVEIEPGLTDTHILSFLKHTNGDLWVGTMGGLHRFEPASNRMTAWTQVEGMPNEYVYCLLEDQDGYVWMSTNNGLVRVDPLSGGLFVFTEDDGLLSNSFNHNACAAGEDGMLYFGSQNGVNHFSPEAIRQNPYLPPVVLTSVTQGGAPIDDEAALDTLERVILRWPNNYFEFEYAGLSYSQPDENRYLYTLEGYDSDWKNGSPAQAGRYTDLPAGTYTLTVRAANNDNLWNDSGASVDVVVLAPFWQSAWFQWGLVLLLVAAVAVGVQYRVYAINQRNRMLAAQVAERTREIEQRRRAAEVLKDILILINSNRPLAESLEFILNQTCALLGAESATLIEFHPDQACILAAVPSPSSSGRAITFPEELMVWFRLQMQDGKARLLDPLPPALAGMAGAVVLQPLQKEDDTQAALLVLFNQKKNVTDEDISLMNAFAEHTSLAIGNDRLRSQAQQLAVLSERNRLARDLHDAVSQTLFSASLITESLPAIWQEDPAEGNAILRDLHRLNRGALAEMRTLLMELRPATIKEARLDDLIRQLVDAACGRTSVEIRLTLDNPYHLPVAVQEALYRVTQEGLNNILKHARASHATISLKGNRARYADGNSKGEVEVILQVEDDGCGFDIMNIPPDHFGIQNMRERAAAVGAELTMTSKPGCGSLIRMTWQGESDL